MDDWAIFWSSYSIVASLIWNERRWIVQSRSLSKLGTQLYHLVIGDYPFVQERLLQLDWEIALIKHFGEVLLREVLQALIDQPLNEMVRVVKHASHDLRVELFRGEVGRLS